MSDPLERLLGQGRLIFTLVTVFVLAGVAAFLYMDRQEDPSFPYRGGIITVAFPGAAPDSVERLVLKPLEEQIAEVEQVHLVKSIARQGVAIVIVELAGSVYDTDSAWDRVRVAMDDARRDYPDGVGQAQLNDRAVDASTVLLAVTGSDDPQILRTAAKKLRKRMIGIDKVSSTHLFGDPGKQVTIAINDAAISRYRLSPQGIANDIRASNKVAAGGSILLAGSSLTLKPNTDFNSIADIRATAIGLPDGGTVPLSALAHVYASSVQPPRERVWYDGSRSVAVEVIAARETTDVVNFGHRVRAAVDDMRAELAPLQIQEMFYQPSHTEERLTNLTFNLLASIAIILGILFVFMGWRMGVIVATLLPLVTLTAIALYALGGGVLQQMAVIGLVVALGILVDNAIVMTENVQWHLNRGATAHDAARRSVRELAGPLLAATGTTLAAFVPMLLADGNAADFLRALPITIMLALSVSYIYAITVTPLLSQRFLRPQATTRRDPLQHLADKLAHVTGRHPGAWLALGIVAIVIALGGMRFVDQEFFPQADRALVIVDITLPEGTHLTTTQRTARILEQALRTVDGVQTVHGFIGTGGPKFYYNLQQQPQAPQRARLVVKTDSLERNGAVINMIEHYSADHLPAANVVASVLSQGPPTTAPIELRVFNRDPQRLVQATEQVFNATLAIDGTRDVRHDLGTGAPSLDYEIQPAVARSFGVTPVDVAQALRGRSNGLIVGQYRAGEDPVPIKLRSPEGEYFSPTALQTTSIYNALGNAVPLMQVATTRLAIEPGAIRHHNQRRVAHVYSQLVEGHVYSQVLMPLKAAVAKLELPPDTHIETGGDAEESGKANAALFTAAPLGLALLLFFLLVQFNSFIRVGLVLLTAPFALVGVVPGLLLLGIPFGFQPMLGLFALTGIVVNNAIVLIDVIDDRWRDNTPLPEAIAEAVRRRTRPILLTTATTIAGLLPLALSNTTLWPPLAWPIITGLLASTVLTLIVLPAVCRLTMKPPPGAHRVTAVLATGVLCFALIAPPPASAQAPADNPVQQVTFADSIRLAPQRARVLADRMQAQAAGAAADRTRRSGRFPTLSANAFASRSDKVGRINTGDAADQFDQSFNFPDVSIPVSDRNKRGATIELRQPMIDAATQLYDGPAAAATAGAAEHTLERSRVASMLDGAEAYLDALTVQARAEANRALVRNLGARASKINALRGDGRALRSDVLEVQFREREAQQQQRTLNQNLQVAQTGLARALGLEGQAVAKPLAFTPPVVTKQASALIEQAIQQREDLAAVDARIRAADLRAKSASAQRLPTLDAVASLHYNDGNAFLPDREGRISAQLTWTLFAGGTISAAHREAVARLAVLRAQRAELTNGLRVEIARALADLRDNRERVELARLGVTSAQETRNTRAARLDAGRANVDDLLDAEATLANRRAQATIARYEVVRAWVRLQSATNNVAALRHAGV